jgi:hypothetical protein
VKIVEFVLFGQPFIAMSAGPLDPFNHAVLFVVNCDDQAELDRCWNALLEGGSAEQCGWLKDRFGLSWQIVPTVLGEMMASPDGAKAKGALHETSPPTTVWRGLDRTACGNCCTVEGDGGQPPFLEREGAKIHLRTREHQVVRAGFAPDGSVVVGAALNRMELPVFDSSDGKLIAMLGLGHQSNDARFSADGTCIVATWLNAVSVVRYPSTARLLELARAQVYRKLTVQERAEFGLPIDGEEPGRA